MALQRLGIYGTMLYDKTGSGLGPQSVRKSSITEVRVIDCISGPPPLWGELFELGHGHHIMVMMMVCGISISYRRHPPPTAIVE
jgi:hypothetical protein